jgi:DNA-binding NarL/FixJ family response regulator
MILDNEPDLSVVAEAGNGVEAVEKGRQLEIDLVIMDVAMPLMTGLQAARELARRKPWLRILMLSMHDNEQYFFESLKAGATGYVLKSVADQDLVDACRAAMRDEPFIYPGVMRTLVRTYLDKLRRGERLPRAELTPREQEVVKLIAEGYSSKEIAGLLTISLKTVEGIGPTSCKLWDCEIGLNSPATPFEPASLNRREDYAH